MRDATAGRTKLGVARYRVFSPTRKDGKRRRIASKRRFVSIPFGRSAQRETIRHGAQVLEVDGKRRRAGAGIAEVGLTLTDNDTEVGCSLCIDIKRDCAV